MARTYPSVIRMIPFLVALSLLSPPVHAQYSGGRGTAQDPYQIATAADLIALGETPGDYAGYFVLTADIDLDPKLPGVKVFDMAVIAPIAVTGKGYVGVPFLGAFDGNGHTISRLTIRGEGYLGFFGRLGIGAKISDLGVVDANVTSSRAYVGGLVGYHLGTVSQCYSTGSISGTDSVGGLIGRNGSQGRRDYPADIDRSYSLARVSGETFVGGLVGEYWCGTTRQCYSAGTVNGSAKVGGLVGGGGAWYVTESFWDVETSGLAVSSAGQGKTTAQMQAAGTFDGKGHTVSHLTMSGGDKLGFFGGLDVGAEIKDLGIVDANLSTSGTYIIGGLLRYNRGSVTRCYISGTVNGVFHVGGLVGFNEGIVSCCYSAAGVSGVMWIGGLVGYNSGKVGECYSTGVVLGSSYTGGLLGYNKLGDDKVTGCFWDTASSGTFISAGGTGKSTTEMRTAKIFLDAGWDFVGETANGIDDIWWIDEGKDYPRLWWETPAIGDR